MCSHDCYKKMVDLERKMEDSEKHIHELVKQVRQEEGDHEDTKRRWHAYMLRSDKLLSPMIFDTEKRVAALEKSYLASALKDKYIKELEKKYQEE